jgi:probable addiction module antidote protein
MIEREIKKLELQNGLVPFDEWFDSLHDLRMQAAATSAARKNCGDNLQNMRLKNYKADLLKRLEDPHYAAEYLALALAEKDSAAFLIALKDVVEAGGGVGNLAGRVGLKRPSLYKILSKNGNPTLETLQEILEPLGLRISVALDKAA